MGMNKTCQKNGFMVSDILKNESNPNTNPSKMYTTILAIHRICGFSALISAFIAIFTQVFNKSMNVHRISGKIFIEGMSGVFLTTLPLVYLRPNIFLLLIGIFSFYLAFMGWRMAVNRTGIVWMTRQDKKRKHLIESKGGRICLRLSPKHIHQPKSFHDEIRPLLQVGF